LLKGWRLILQARRERATVLVDLAGSGAKYACDGLTFSNPHRHEDEIR
jgi:hypothetical protein